MFLTDAQLHEIRDIIRTYHAAFIVNNLGPEAVDPETLKKLQDAGLVDEHTDNLAEEAYLYGQLLAFKDDPLVQTMTYDQFKQYVRDVGIPLGPIERRAVDWAAHSSAQYVVGLGNRVDTATGALLVEADAQLREQMRSTIQTLTAESIARRETAKQLKSKLGWATGDWTRDLDRIAVTEIQDSLNHGTADHYSERYGSDVEVFRQPAPDACKHCLRLFIGNDGVPRIFKLSQLVANGTNVGRKANDWQPVVGTVHPHCGCTFHRVPAGWGFNEAGELAPGGKLGERFEGEEELELALRYQDDLRKAFDSGVLDYQGIPVHIENAPGSVRHWHAPDGTSGDTVMRVPYGYVCRTNGVDEDEVDVFVGPDLGAERVFILHQQDPLTGEYDEDKVMLGCQNGEQAYKLYADHYTDPAQFLLTATSMEVGQFKRWLTGTEARPGEMGAGAAPIFVITMEKATGGEGSGLQDPAFATQFDPAGNRAPGPGLGVAYYIPTPKRDRRGKGKVEHAPVEEMIYHPQAGENGGLIRDKEIYEFPEQLHQVHTLPAVVEFREVPEVVDPHQVYRNRQRANQQIDRDLGRPRNVPNPEGEDGEKERNKRSSVR